jgi:hypothetical protein
MVAHLEFVVPGPPVSNQSPGPNLTTWRATVRGAAMLVWSNSPLTKELKAVIINFYAGNRPSVDVDNMSKPILDELNNLVYDDDRQIVQVEITHTKIGAAYQVMGARPIIVTGLQAGNQFVYVRIEDPVDPFPLPK